MIEVLPVVVLLLVAAALYGVGARRIWRRGSRRVLPPARAACFGLALVVLAVALIPLDAAADSRFSVHMVQHVLLVFVAAPLIALATPITVLVVSLSPNARRHTTTPVLRSRAARFVLSPPFALVSFLGVMLGSHVPAIYDAAVAHQALHDLEHLLYVLTAVLFWSAIAGLDIGPARLAHPARLLYLFLSMATMSVLGLTLSGTGQALYPHYVQEAKRIGVSAVADQHSGGVIMWLSGMFVMVLAMVAVLLAWLAEDERRTVLADARRESVSPLG